MSAFVLRLGPGQMTSHKGYNEPGPVCLIGPSCTRLPLVVLFSFSLSLSSSPSISYGDRAFSRSPRHPSSSSLLVLFSPDASPSEHLLSAPLRLLRYKLRRSPGTVEIIKRRPAFGATSGIRVGALYSRHYPPRKLGRDETALSLSLFLLLLPPSLCLLLPATTPCFFLLPSFLPFSSSFRLSSIFLFSIPSAALSSK